MTYDSRIAVSRRNYTVVIGLYGVDVATKDYRYEPALDAIDDVFSRDGKIATSRRHFFEGGEK